MPATTGLSRGADGKAERAPPTSELCRPAGAGRLAVAARFDRRLASYLRWWRYTPTSEDLSRAHVPAVAGRPPPTADGESQGERTGQIRRSGSETLEMSATRPRVAVFVKQWGG